MGGANLPSRGLKAGKSSAVGYFGFFDLEMAFLVDSDVLNLKLWLQTAGPKWLLLKSERRGLLAPGFATTGQLHNGANTEAIITSIDTN